MNVQKNKPKTNLRKIDLYKSEMEKIGFMAEDINDIPEIFDTGSEKCKLFLIKSFTVLSANFHYLSLLGNDTIGQELLKAACILQLYPFDHTQKTNEIFHNMSELDIQMFWMKFFNQCKLHNDFGDSSFAYKQNIGGKFQTIFSEMNTTHQYLNYDISVTNSKKLKETDLNQEILSWPVSVEVNNSDNVTYHQSVDVESKESQNDIEHDKFISNVNYIKKETTHKNLSPYIPKYFHMDFLVSFNQSIKEINSFKDNLTLISSVTLKDIVKSTTSLTKSNCLLNNSQIKRCNNIIEDIRLKKQHL